MSPKTANSERRKNTRKRPPSLIYVELNVTNGGMMRDLCEDGFALRAMMPLTAGESTPFSFLLGETERIEGVGQIIWVEEKGRVAGIQFTEVSPQVRRQIRSWMNEIPDSLEAKEEGEQPSTANAQSFAQLREELRSSPPRPESARSGGRIFSESETVNAAPPSVANKWPKEMPTDVQQPTVDEAAKAQEPEHLHRVDPIPFPGLLSFSPTNEGIEIRFEPEPPDHESLEHGSGAEQPPRRMKFPVVAEESTVARPRLPSDMPDISKILMQPSRKATEHPLHKPILEPLEPLNAGRRMVESDRTGWFTLGRAVTIMVVLACVVALSAYRHAAGQGLIWLGEQMGGAQVSQAPVPPTPEDASNAESTLPSSNPSNPAIQAPASSTPVDGNPDHANTNNGATPKNSNAQTALPSVTQNPPPPVTPLSGIAPSPAAEQGPETGLVEYAKAMQLLHGKDGTASDPSEAVRLLWVSVEKGNASAELTLAEMYWHGEGVARNCDQTRILLSAAARKGNGEAQKRLRQFQREGCE